MLGLSHLCIVLDKAMRTPAARMDSQESIEGTACTGRGLPFPALLKQSKVCSLAHDNGQTSSAECGILLLWLHCGQQLPDAFVHKRGAALRPSTLRTLDVIGSQEYIGPHLAAGTSGRCTRQQTKRSE